MGAQVETFFDAQALQNPHSAERGIGRYVSELADRLMRLDFEPPVRFLLNPHLPVPGRLEPLLAGAEVVRSDAVMPTKGVLHVPSPFEPVPLPRLWPPHLRHLRLAVTIHDLIPAVFPNLYLRDPQYRQWYKNRLRYTRHADLVLVPSFSTARDVERRLRVPEHQIVVTFEAPPASFVPAADRSVALAAARTAVPALEAGYILYTGGMDIRKNVWGLIAAYGKLPRAIRAQHQLVVVCAIAPDQKQWVADRVAESGVEDRVIFTGYVQDADLVRLCQAAHLFVFPSLYEGYGLPVAEAIATKVPVIAANTPAVAELIRDDRALFNPYDPRSIAGVLERSLVDDTFREELRARRLPTGHTWESVAGRTKEAYESLARRRPRRVDSRTRIAFVSPLPPAAAGVADYSLRLLSELQDLVEIDVFVDDPAAVVAPEVRSVRKLIAFDAMENLRGYDDVVCCFGNSAHHTGAFSLLFRKNPIVLAHDTRLTDLYAAIAEYRPDLERVGYYRALRRMYGRRYPREVGRSGWISAEVADAHGVLMARDLVNRSKKILVHSEFAARLLRLDARRRDISKISVVPFGHPAVGEIERGQSAQPLVATFGLATSQKRIDLFIEAMAEVKRHIPEAEFAIVGGIEPEGERAQHLTQLERLGLSRSCTLTGRIDAATYRDYLSRASVAVQLRGSTNGETSGAVADCLAAGVPTVVTALGAARELPDDAVEKIGVAATASELADRVVSLLSDRDRRQALTAGARGYAGARSFAIAAQTLFETLPLDRRRPSPAAARA